MHTPATRQKLHRQRLIDSWYFTFFVIDVHYSKFSYLLNIAKTSWIICLYFGSLLLLHQNRKSDILFTVLFQIRNESKKLWLYFGGCFFGLFQFFFFQNDWMLIEIRCGNPEWRNNIRIVCMCVEELLRVCHSIGKYVAFPFSFLSLSVSLSLATIFFLILKCAIDKVLLKSYAKSLFCILWHLLL